MPDSIVLAAAILPVVAGTAVPSRRCPPRGRGHPRWLEDGMCLDEIE